MTKEEIQLIDDTFASLKSKILDVFDTKKNIKKNDLYKESLLYFEFKDIPLNITKEINNLPTDKYLLEKLEYLKDELEKEIIIKKPSQNLSPKLLSERTKHWNFLNSTLLDIHKNISEEIYNKVFLEDLANNDIELNRSQISLLMLYLRDNKAIKNLPDLKIAKLVEPLTGYSYKQLRLKVVGSAKSERNLITQKKEDYLKLKKLLEHIIADIEQDMKKAKLV